MKIIDNLWQVGGDNLTASGDAAIYLVKFGDRAISVYLKAGKKLKPLFETIWYNNYLHSDDHQADP